jgi:hypothetical protein
MFTLRTQAVEGLLAISDYQRRRVFNRVRPTARQLNRLRTRRRRDGGISPSSGGTMSPAHASVRLPSLVQHQRNLQNVIMCTAVKSAMSAERAIDMAVDALKAFCSGMHCVGGEDHGGSDTAVVCGAVPVAGGQPAGAGTCIRTPSSQQ